VAGKKLDRPILNAQEMADLVTFLASRSQSRNFARTMDAFAYAVPKGGQCGQQASKKTGSAFALIK
jgi:hypothetical protein